jgi:hypothetical protein
MPIKQRNIINKTTKYSHLFENRRNVKGIGCILTKTNAGASPSLIFLELASLIPLGDDSDELKTFAATETSGLFHDPFWGSFRLRDCPRFARASGVSTNSSQNPSGTAAWVFVLPISFKQA